MPMYRSIALLLFVLVGLGCRPAWPEYWYHPDKTLEEARKDCRECRDRARVHAQEEYILRYRDSMEHRRPWQMENEVIEQADRDFDKEQAFTACMTEKGYQQRREFPLDTEVRRGTGYGPTGTEHLAGR